MFASLRNPAAAYKQVSVESEITAADPHRLIMLLFEGAQAAMQKALVCLKQNDIPGKGLAISKAIDIIGSGLRASINMEAGSDLAEKLDALYDYMTNRLLYANLKNDVAAVEEVISLLGEIQSAWAEIRPQVLAGTAPAPGSTEA